MAETTTDLAAAIRAKVVEARSWETEDSWDAMCNLTDAILARHAPSMAADPAEWCRFDYKTWPCPDVRDLATAWGVEP